MIKSALLAVFVVLVVALVPTHGWWFKKCGKKCRSGGYPGYLGGYGGFSGGYGAGLGASYGGSSYGGYDGAGMGSYGSFGMMGGYGMDDGIGGYGMVGGIGGYGVDGGIGMSAYGGGGAGMFGGMMSSYGGYRGGRCKCRRWCWPGEIPRGKCPWCKKCKLIWCCKYKKYGR